MHYWKRLLQSKFTIFKKKLFFFRLYGCYENLVGGQLADALQDVSGGVAETINVVKFLSGDSNDSNGKLFQALRNAFDHNALIVAAIAVSFCLSKQILVVCLNMQLFFVNTITKKFLIMF